MNIIQKFNSKKPLMELKSLPFSFYSSAIYLDCYGHLLERNGELILVTQDPYYQQEFPAIFLPNRQINQIEASVTFTSEADIKKLEKNNIEIIIKKPIGGEFFYTTKLLLNPEPKIKRRIEQFKKSYKYKISHSWPKEKVKDFYFEWKKQKKRSGDNFAEVENFFFFCLDNLRTYKAKQVYVTVNDKLVGLAWGMEHQSGNWMGLQLKANYKFKGLSRFLHHERSKLFADKKLFTLGTGAQDEGIIQFKRELGPIEEKNYYYVLTGKKVGK